MDSASVTDNPSPPAPADEAAAEHAADLREVKPVAASAKQAQGEESPRKRGGKERDAKAAKPARQAAPLEVPDELPAKVEAVLLSASRAVAAGKIAQAVGLAPASAADDADDAPDNDEAAASSPGKAPSITKIIKAAIERLNEQYAESGRSFRVEEVSGGFRLMILPEYGEVLEAFHGVRDKTTLTRAAIETLAIIAYKQPITRARLESIRGVACGDVLRSLSERRLVTPVGRAEELGRPILYGTTRRFLETFGLKGLGDLPSVEDLRVRDHAQSAAAGTTDGQD